MLRIRGTLLQTGEKHGVKCFLEVNVWEVDFLPLTLAFLSTFPLLCHMRTCRLLIYTYT